MTEMAVYIKSGGFAQAVLQQKTLLNKSGAAARCGRFSV